MSKITERGNFEFITRRMSKIQNLGVHDNLFGGDMLSWLDEAGVMYARMAANSKSMVTRHIGEHEFRSPVKSGEQVDIFGRIIRKGTTSIAIELVAEKIVLDTGEREIVTNTEMVFVRIDDNGNKKKINWPDEG